MVITTHANDIKERLSVAYVTAVAARAGCQVTKLDIDKQSIDATIRPIRGPKVSIDFQLKATSRDCLDEANVIFSLPVNNYDDLRDTKCTAPHYLVVLVLELTEFDWLSNDEEALLIRRCAYWLDLRGSAPTTNRETVSVKLPRQQIFDVTTFTAMMRDAHAKATQSVDGST